MEVICFILQDKPSQILTLMLEILVLLSGMFHGMFGSAPRGVLPAQRAVSRHVVRKQTAALSSDLLDLLFAIVRKA